jgi:hypothetical protein
VSRFVEKFDRDVSQRWAFGPVMERVVTGMIDLDTGALVDFPMAKQPGERDEERYDWINGRNTPTGNTPNNESRPWMRAHGIDAAEGNHDLIGVDLLLARLGSRDWTTLTPAAEKKLRDLNLPGAATDAFNGLGAYGFKTREGRLGMIEIVDQNVPRGVKIRYKLVARSHATPYAQPPQVSNGASATPRTVVSEFLRRIKAVRENKADAKEVWELTTRSVSWGPDFANLSEYDRIHPVHQLGNGEETMVASDPFNDDAGRVRVYYAVLLKRDGKWLINEHGYRSRDEVSGLVQGFKLNPGVKLDVQAAELTGQWDFPCKSSLAMSADGTGVQIYEGPIGMPEKPRSFRWDVSGSALRRYWPDSVETLEITRVDHDSFDVVRLDGPGKGYAEGFNRRSTDQQSKGPDGAATHRGDAPKSPETPKASAITDPTSEIEMKVAQRQLEKTLADLQDAQTEEALLPSRTGLSEAEQKAGAMKLELKLKALEEQAARLRAEIQQRAPNP